jgi:hypothetical protein
MHAVSQQRAGTAAAHAGSLIRLLLRAQTGLAWLFMGVANSDAKLYDDELQEILATYPDQVGLVAHRHLLLCCS